MGVMGLNRQQLSPLVARPQSASASRIMAPTLQGRDPSRDGGRRTTNLMQAVAQKDTYGCVIACLAAVTGVSYDDVRSILGEPGRGFTHITWGEFLYQRGYAVQFFYRHDPVAKSDRKVWPFEPWADVHLCSVDAGHGDGTHLIVLLRDGRVLDPISSEPKRLSDYPSVSYMAAVHSTGSAPCRLEH